MKSHPSVYAIKRRNRQENSDRKQQRHQALKNITRSHETQGERNPPIKDSIDEAYRSIC